MCYTAGPRCSPHALKKLVDAKDDFNQVDPTDLEKMNEAKHALFVAQEEYLTSPAGIKKLQDKAKSTGDIKYAMQAKEYATERKRQIAVSKALVAEQNEAIAAAEKKAAVKEAMVNSGDPEALKQHEEKIRQLEDEFTTLEKFKVPENLVTQRINAEYKQDGTQCGYDGQCRSYPGDYCRDSEYINLHVNEDSVSVRGTLADIYDCDENDIPDELEKIGREELNLDNAEYYVAESEYGYYGVEGAHVTLASPFRVQDRLREYYDAEYRRLKVKESDLEKISPSIASKSTTSVSKGKSVPGRNGTATRKVPSAKRGAAKVAFEPVKTKRRERTPAELDAFELDEMTPPPRRNATVPRNAKKASPAPKRRERTDAELDAFERDERD